MLIVIASKSFVVALIFRSARARYNREGGLLNRFCLCVYRASGRS